MDDKELNYYIDSARNLSKRINYDEEPVWYCTSCLSLAIIRQPDTEVPHYCKECSSTNIKTTDISNWRYIYSTKYGVDYLNQNKTK